MSQTESEMWQAISKSDEAGQLVYSGPPAGPADATIREFFDRGWQDISLFGMPGGHYRGSALALSIAVMCADVKARDISKAEMLLWERTGARGWRLVEASRNPIARLLLEAPNDSDTWPEFWRMVILHLGLAQNAYVYKDIADDGTVVGLYPLVPSRVQRMYSAAGRIFYGYSTASVAEEVKLGQTYFVIPEDRIIHLRDRLFDGIDGLSNFAVGNPIFALMDAIGEYQTGLFGNNGKLAMVFETDQSFPNTDQGNASFQRLKAQLTERTHKAAATGAPILLEAGLKAKVVALNAKDAATVETFNQTVLRICGLMQIPPHKIFALESVAYNNQSAMDRMYANDCLMPTAVNVETKFRNGLLPRRKWATTTPQFDRAALMANDPETLVKFIDTGMKAGLIQIDEGRELMPFRLNPLGEEAGGHDRTVPVNMALVKPDGTVRQAAEGQNATNPGAGESQSPDNNAPKGLRLVQ
jgi:HK97 family phage portal protein